MDIGFLVGDWEVDTGFLVGVLGDKSELEVDPGWLLAGCDMKGRYWVSENSMGVSYKPELGRMFNVHPSRSKTTQ